MHGHGAGLGDRDGRVFGGLDDVNTAAAWWLFGGTFDGWVEERGVFMS